MNWILDLKAFQCLMKIYSCEKVSYKSQYLHSFLYVCLDVPLLWKNEPQSTKSWEMIILHFYIYQVFMNLVPQLDKLLSINQLVKFTWFKVKHDYPNTTNNKRLKVSKGYLKSRLYLTSHNSCKGSFFKHFNIGEWIYLHNETKKS
jgi:hypothetical protein